MGMQTFRFTDADQTALESLSHNCLKAEFPIATAIIQTGRNVSKKLHPLAKGVIVHLNNLLFLSFLS
jgi:hypothetical protein